MDFLTKIKKGYFYFFYRLYIFFDASALKWWSDWKASVSITMLEIYFLITIQGIISIILNVDLFFEITANLVIWIIIGTLNFIIFIHNDKWKTYIEEWEHLSKRKVQIGVFIVCAIIAFILGSLVFMFYLLSRTTFNH